MTTIKPIEILEGLTTLHTRYAHTERKMITAERYESLVVSSLIQDLPLDSPLLCEYLIEHVGHLPIIASYLHQFLVSKDTVDLGRVLIMLSIHDISETVLGDKLTYYKSDEEALQELNIAKDLLPTYLLPYYEEFEKRESYDAKFAKSVDSIAPLIHEIVLPEVSKKRMAFYHFTKDMIIAKKRPHFEWDTNLLAVFDECLKRY